MRRSLLLVSMLLLPTLALAAEKPDKDKKPTLAVLPFIPETAEDKDIALDFRRRLAMKATASGSFARTDNVQVDSIVSALGVVTTEPYSDADLDRILVAVETDYTLVASVKGRTVTATLYKGVTKHKSTVVTMPGGKDSPKFALEQIWKDLVGDTVQFARVRDKEVDHDDAEAEARFNDPKNPNLALDPGFDDALKDAKSLGRNWGAILGATRYPAPLITEAAAKALGQDKVAIVPKSVSGTIKGLADDPDVQNGRCLMMRMSKNVAESNGLACESIWIPVDNGKKYRFSVWYHSTGPVPRLFLKGFAFNPDQFGNKSDPEAVRREYYRFQVLPRKQNLGWDLIEADFTPSTNKPTDPKIQWLRVDLYIYLKPGDVFFDDVIVKKIDKN